jgi:8-hydroxy-5-deazaflavin:NADPH oxidoreductase
VRIGLIGAGKIGGTLARLFVAQGHEVALSNSRGPETLAELVAEIGPSARAVTPAEAAEFGEVVVVSVPLGRYQEVPTAGMAGKTVIDTNNYYPQRDGHISPLDDDSTTSAELLAKHLPDAHVVKAFNQIRWDHLGGKGKPAGTPGRIGIPIAGDDAGAKQVVIDLIDQIGFDAVDTGPLATGRLFQPNTSLYVADVTADKIRAVVAAS